MEELIYEIIDEMTLGLCFEIHKSCKRGIFFLEDVEIIPMSEFEIMANRGKDIFGEVNNIQSKKQFDCICPNCQKNTAASRFAPHLEKCMGMEPCSLPRIISRRTTAITRSKEKVDEVVATTKESDSSDDNDWSSVGDIKKGRNGKKAKKCLKNSREIKKIPKENNPNNNITSNKINENSVIFDSSALSYEAMSLDEKRNFLQKNCGVVSEHTKKLCNRSS